MAKKTGKNESKGYELMQAYLKVDCMGSGNPPRIVLRKASDESHTADLVLLPGVVVEVSGVFPDCAKWSEQDSWDICSKVAERLRLAEQTETDTPRGMRTASILRMRIPSFATASKSATVTGRCRRRRGRRSSAGRSTG